MKNEQLIKEWGTLAQLFDNLDNIELNYESCMDLAAQAEKIAKQLDPEKYKKMESGRMKRLKSEKYTAEKMNRFLEPHFIGTVRKSGDLYISRNRENTLCYVYFAGKND